MINSIIKKLIVAMCLIGVLVIISSILVVLCIIPVLVFYILLGIFGALVMTTLGFIAIM